MTYIFWISLLVVVYTYLGYPLILWLLVFLKKTFLKSGSQVTRIGEYKPSITLIIPAYNEEKWIAKKIENSIQLEYPPSLYQIYIISDGSYDTSVDIVNSYLEKYPDRIKHFHQQKREGKVGAINRIMSFLNSEIAVFTDANAMLNSTALIHLVSHFSDAQVGAVAGEKSISKTNHAGITTQGEGAYWYYESQLKQWDSDLKTVVGAAGELLAIRTDLIQHVPDNAIIEDFYMSMQLLEKGFEIRYAPTAIASETASMDLTEEFKRKTRIAAGGMQATFRFLPLLNPFEYGLVSFLLFSHRILRWTLAPLSLILLLLSNIYLGITTQGIYYLLLIGHILVYAAAIVGWMQARRQKISKVFYVPFYFLFMNLAVMIGNTKFLLGTQTALWEKSKRIIPD